MLFEKEKHPEDLAAPAAVADYVKGVEPEAPAVVEQDAPEDTPSEQVATQQLSDESKGHPPYLRKKGTTQIFAYNPHLAERDDMSAWPWPTIQKPAMKPVAEIEKGERIADIMRAISELKPHEFSGQGVPKMAAIRDKIGYVVSGQERDEAYNLYRKGAR